MAEPTQAPSEPRLPRVTIQFCTQCKWMLRAAYYAQELLSTFSTSLGEVALQPATGGVFVVDITTTTTTTIATTTSQQQQQQEQQQPVTQQQQQQRVLLWDRKVDGGFPETKELKRRVRDVIQPGRDLGHVDREYPGRSGGQEAAAAASGGEEKMKGEGEEVSSEVKGEEAEKGGEGGKVCDVGEGGGKCEDCE
ncbi:Rdx family-domain-containing protein [Chaetomidium leptoderma]|uniref:Rdx family-domain-containing protein n=1 Tax=Chaetomidium leptoderma TaxID=669021 RepID=A0AAN6VXL0_9PEZI|nr:Rdx family-domain-containing protein [Chaetomidium leptoderma]